MNQNTIYPSISISCADPLTLSPLILTRNGKLVLHSFYEVLFELDHFNGTPYGRIGKEWHWMVDDEGYDVMRVEIYDYIYDSLGNHYTAYDTYFCYMNDLQAGQLQNFDYFIKEIRVVDNYLIDFVVNKGKKNALLIEYSVLGKCLQYTRAAYEASVDQMDTTPVGTGRYVLQEYIPGQRLTVTLSKSYWQREELCKKFQQANVQTITYEFITNSDQKAEALLSGKVDCISNIAVHQLEALRRDGRFEIKSWLQDTVAYLMPNCGPDSPCRDMNLRAAVFYACDSNAFIAACGGEEKAVRTYCFGTPGIGNYNPAWEQMENYYTVCDTELAAQYLRQSSYAGETLRIFYDSDEFGEYYAACAEVLRSTLEKLHIPSTVTPLNSEQLRTLWNKQSSEWDFCISSWASQDNMANFFDKIYDVNRFSTGLGEANIQDDTLYAMFRNLYCQEGNTQENIDAFHEYETGHFYSYGLFQPKCYDVYRKDRIAEISKNERLWLMPNAFRFVPCGKEEGGK